MTTETKKTTGFKKPTALKKLQGTYRPHRAPQQEPDPDKKAPDPPEWLSEEARTWWEYVVPKLEPVGLATAIDGIFLALLAETGAMWHDAHTRLDQEGLTMVTENGYHYPHPSAGLRKTLFQELVQLGKEFGLTPASRTKIDLLIQQETKTLAQELFELANG